MAYFCTGPSDSLQLQMEVMRSTHMHAERPPSNYVVIPSYTAYNHPQTHNRARPMSGFSCASRPPCTPCNSEFRDRGDLVVHQLPKQLKRSKSFTQACDNPVVLRSDYPQSVPKKSHDIPLYNSLDDPHLEEYYRRKFKSQKNEQSTVVANAVSTTDACAVYKVIIATGDMSAAGTYANVFLRINGAKGKLNKIRLKRPLKDLERSSARHRPFHFAPSSVHSFKVYSPDLGDLRYIILEHDGLEKKDGWFVEYVEIANVTRGYSWHFTCNDWLSAYKSDGKIARELYAERIEVADYEVIVITGDRDNCETDANVYITMFGKKGHTDRLPLRNRKRWCFRRGQTDRFVVRGRNVGKFKKIRIEHDNSGLHPKWFVERIVVSYRDDPRQRYFFACGAWLSLEDEDRVISREFLASLTPFAGRKECRYKIVAYTGKQPDAGTDSDIFIQLIGEMGISDTMRLETPYLRVFERGSEDAFLMRIPSVGVLKKLRIRNCNNGVHPAWYLVKVLVEDLDENRIYQFPCRRWIGGDRARGHVWVELIQGTIQDDYDSNKSETDFHFRVHTSGIRNAGTDSHVHVQLYGELGKTKVLRFEGAGERFETGKVDDIYVPAENVGKPYKMRIWHDNKGVCPGWHLDKVELMFQRKRFIFPCGRWLAKDEDDGEIVRELPATGDDIEHPLPLLKYQVTVVTGGKMGSGTDANVFCCLNGERGDTGDRQLSKSTTNVNKFERGNSDEFIIEAVDLKKIKSIRIGHDNSGVGPGWFLDKVIVREQSGKYGREQVFPCNRWLAADEEDGQISRELTEHGSHSLKQTTYQVLVKTGDEFGAGTDANCFITMCGDKSETSRLALKMSETHRTNKFERNQIDEFYYELDDLGKLVSVKISQDGSLAGADWYVEEVVIFVPKDGLEYLCPARRWIKASDGEVVLPVTSIKQKDKKTIDNDVEGSIDIVPSQLISKNDSENAHIALKVIPKLIVTYASGNKQAVPYEITIWTGDKMGAGTDANVFFQLYGADNQKTDEIKLDNRSNNFERNAKETFKINAVDIGRIQKMRIGHDNSGPSSGWYLEKVLLRRLKASRRSSNRESLDKRRSGYGSRNEPDQEDDVGDVENYWFFVRRWFAKDEDDKQIVRVLIPTDENGRPLADLDLTDYELHVLTGDKFGAGTDANVSVNLFGDKGESGLIELKDSLLMNKGSKNKFERAQKDSFLIAGIPHLGDMMRKLHIRTDASGAGADWLLDHVDIVDRKTGRHWFFNCNDWLGGGRDKTVFKDLQALAGDLKEKSLLQRRASKSTIGNQSLEENANLTTYNINVETGRKSGSGTDANVYIIIYGTDSSTDQLWLKNSKNHKNNKFENGQTDIFEYKLMDIGDVKKIKIGHDDAGFGSNWYLEQVVIEAPRLGRRWVFPCRKWLSKDKDDKKLERELYPQELATEEFIPHVPYEITVYTSTKRGAGTDANVFVCIYGPNGNTEDKNLCSSKEERKKRFEDGSVDSFVLELPDVGNDIEKLRIGHDNAGFGPGWHLDRVEVRKFIADPRTGQLSTTEKRMWLFPCNNWFDKSEGDRKIVRELAPSKVFDEYVGRDGKTEQKEYVLKEHEKAREKKYKVRVYTGDKSGAGSDANVFATFYSETSDTGENKLSSSQNFNKFERAQMDEFEITSLDIGRPIKCRIRQDNSSLLKSAWFLDKVELVDLLDNNTTYTFHCERWLSSSHDDKKIERTLWEKGYDGDKSSMASSKASARVGSQVSLESSVSQRRLSRKQSVAIEEAPEGPVIPYVITIRTGRERDAGTRSNAWCRLFGPQPQLRSRLRDRSSPRESFNTGRLFLELPHKNGFVPGSTETFNCEAAELTEVNELELGHDGEAPGSGWFVEEVVVEVPTRGKRYSIPFNCWFAKDQGDGRTVRVVRVDEHQAASFKPKVPYEITFHTGDVQEAGTSCNVIFTLFGEAKSTGEIVVEKTAERFERATTDTVKLELEDVGKPIRLRVTHSKRGDRQDWYLDFVDVVNMKTMESTRFQCGEWVSERKGSKRVVHDLVPVGLRGRETVAKTSYKIHVKTSSMSGAGTNANVFAIIFGSKGDSGELPLKRSETHSNPFQNGKEDVFSLNDIYSLGDLTKIRVWHDNSGFGSSWHLDSIRVHDSGANKWYDFPCNRWLSKSEDDKQLVRELACATGSAPSKSPGDYVTYEISLATSDRPGSSSLHNPWIILHGERNSTREIVFDNTLRNQLLRSGQIDTFKVEQRNLGKLTRVTIGLVAGSDPKASLKDGWNCQDVTVTDTATGDKYVFPCDQSIAAYRRVSPQDGTLLLLKNVEVSTAKAVRTSQPVKYEVAVVTGDQGTDANVSITIYGELGDTGKRELKQKWKDLFEKGNTDTFTIEALDLGELTKAKIEHDNSSWRRNWFLERVEITNKSTGKKWTFPCKNWLSKEKGDYQISRELLPTGNSGSGPTTPVVSARPLSPQTSGVPAQSPHSSRPSSPHNTSFLRPDSPLASGRLSPLQRSSASAVGDHPALLRRPTSPAGAPSSFGTTGLSRPTSGIRDRYSSKDF